MFLTGVCFFIDQTLESHQSLTSFVLSNLLATFQSLFFVCAHFCCLGLVFLLYFFIFWCQHLFNFSYQAESNFSNTTQALSLIHPEGWTIFQLSSVGSSHFATWHSRSRFPNPIFLNSLHYHWELTCSLLSSYMGLRKSSRVASDYIYHKTVGLALGVPGEDVSKSENPQRRQAWWEEAEMLGRMGVEAAAGEPDCSIQIRGEWFRNVNFMLLYCQVWAWES